MRRRFDCGSTHADGRPAQDHLRRDAGEACQWNGRVSGDFKLSMKRSERTYRLQVELSKDDKQAIDDFRFAERLPSRAVAVRELLRRGLTSKSAPPMWQTRAALLLFGRP